MLDETLFMETRLFRMFRENARLSAKEANRLFEEHGIWSFIEDCYDVLHLESDEVALQAIHVKLAHQGVSL